MINATMCYNCTKAKVCKFKDIITANEKTIEKIEKEFYDFRAKEKLTPLEFNVTCVEKTTDPYTSVFPTASHNIEPPDNNGTFVGVSSSLEGWMGEYEK